MLDVRNLSVWYDQTQVLRDVTFAVPERRIVALLGGNGSGKTTILNALSGLLKPRTGSIRVAGQEAAGAAPDQMVRLGMVQVPQGREVFASLTVRDISSLALRRLRGQPLAQAAMAHVFELFPRWSTSPRTARAHERRPAAATRHRPRANVPSTRAADGRAVSRASAQCRTCSNPDNQGVEPWRPHHIVGGAECRLPPRWLRPLMFSRTARSPTLARGAAAHQQCRGPGVLPGTLSATSFNWQSVTSPLVPYCLVDSQPPL
jgi:energy-coupling factor transporter ATP-binding protein EcfA2